MAKSEPSAPSATNAKYWPLMRDTASTGTTGPSRVPHTTRARMNCAGRSVPPVFWIRAFTSTVCVWGSACGEMNVTRLSATTAPVPSRMRTGIPIRSWPARSTGTET